MYTRLRPRLVLKVGHFNVILRAGSLYTKQRNRRRVAEAPVRIHDICLFEACSLQFIENKRSLAQLYALCLLILKLLCCAIALIVVLTF